jgi:hypothetical protein
MDQPEHPTQPEAEILNGIKILYPKEIKNPWYFL